MFQPENKKNDLEKRVSSLEDKLEFFIQPLLYDVTEKALAPIRVGWGSIVLWWLRARWGMDKRESARKTLLEAAEKLALNSPGSWPQEFREFVEEKKKK